MTLTGRVHECVSELTPEVIGGDDGVKKIIEKLDKLLMKDQNTRAYLAFKEFYDYRRPAGASITDFIVRFEYLYHKLKQLDMKLPEGVQALFSECSKCFKRQLKIGTCNSWRNHLRKYESKNTENIWRSCCL